jgi:hypothetical protein
MAMGDLETPRQHLVRAAQGQDDALARNQGRIDRADAEREEARSKVQEFERTAGDPSFQSTIESQYGDLSRFEAYEGFAVPYADLVRAIYLVGASSDASDFDTARNVLRRVAGMVPENPFVREDLDLADRLSTGGVGVPDLTYVILETGVAAYRKQVKIPVPIFLVSNEVQVVPIAVPYLEFVEGHAPNATITAPGLSVSTSMITDVDRLVAVEFKEQLPTLITRMIVAAAFKSGVQYGAAKATEGDQWLNLAAQIGGAIYAYVANEADLRTWATLPKQVQYARFETPPGASVTYDVAGYVGSVQLAPDGLNLVHIRSVTAGAPPVVTNINLKPSAAHAARSDN